jgi:hypothetical protein
MQAVGAMYSIDVLQVCRVLFFVRECRVVLDYGGRNMAHRRVLHKKQLRAHGHVKQADVVKVQAVSSLIQVQLSVKVNKMLKQSLHNRCVQILVIRTVPLDLLHTCLSLVEYHRLSKVRATR